MIEGLDNVFGSTSTIKLDDGIRLIHKSAVKASKAEDGEAKNTLARSFQLMKAMRDSCTQESDEVVVDSSLLEAVQADANEAGDGAEQMSSVIEKIEKRFVGTEPVTKVEEDDDTNPEEEPFSWGSNDLTEELKKSGDELDDWGPDPEGVAVRDPE